MDDQYREYFRENLTRQEGLGNEERALGPPFRLDPEVEIAAQSAAVEALERAREGLPLRPDAELLLLLLAREFVTRPVTAVRGPGSVDGELTVDLEEDLRTVLRTALEERTDDEITSHGVIDALSRRWGQLRTASENVWG